MWNWIKSHGVIIITSLVCSIVMIFICACEPKVRSINGGGLMVTRQELQLELNHLMDLAELRMLNLDRQEQLRTMVLNNAVILAQGQPFNPLGLLTGLAAIYGVSQGGVSVGKRNITKRNERNVDNGTV